GGAHLRRTRAQLADAQGQGGEAVGEFVGDQLTRGAPRATLVPYTTLFRSEHGPHPADAEANALGRDPRVVGPHHRREADARVVVDRKSTRLNSSHVKSSYAGFCLKRKTAHSWRGPCWYRAQTLTSPDGQVK